MFFDSGSSANDVIVLPATLAYGKTWGQWQIVDCWAKLLDKYGDPDSQSYSNRYDGYRAERVASDPSWQDRIDRDDLKATRLMSSRIGNKEIEAILARKDAIEEVLRRIPLDLSLDGEIANGEWQAIEELFRRIEMPRVGLARITKLLCLKRPTLIPMMDSYVRGFLFEHEWPLEGGEFIEGYAAAGIVVMKQLRELLHYERNLSTIRSLCDCFNARSREQSPDRAALEVSPVRVLETLLWFDWDAYRWFGWGYDGTAVRKAGCPAS
jgi:Family of unknown function (DUF6308)